MDQALRRWERILRERPHDPAVWRRYRQTLRRAGHDDPSVWRAADALYGTVHTPCAIGSEADPGPLGEPGLVHVPGRTLEEPVGAWWSEGRWEEAWRAGGRVRGITAGVVLVEGEGGALEGRASEGGEVAWVVPSGLPDVLGAAGEHVSAERLGWVTAPWGAVELSAVYEVEPERRRVGYHEGKGRRTMRAVVGWSASEVTSALVVATPGEGGWGLDAPEQVLETAGPGEELGGGELALQGDDGLWALSLDVHAPQFAVRWRDARTPWATYRVTSLPDLPPALGPAGWRGEPDDEPLRLGSVDPTRASVGERLHVGVEGQELVRRDPVGGEHGRVRLPEEVEDVNLLGLDGAVAVLGWERPGRPWWGWWPWGEASLVEAPGLAERLEGRAPRVGWRPLSDPDRDAQVCVGARGLYLQLGSEELVVLRGVQR